MGKKALQSTCNIVIVCRGGGGGGGANVCVWKGVYAGMSACVHVSVVEVCI